MVGTTLLDPAAQLVFIGTADKAIGLNIVDFQPSFLPRRRKHETELLNVVTGNLEF
jgi:hypothetical protein